MTEKRVGFYPALGGVLDIGRSMGASYSTPYRRIAVAANEAKRKYKPFEADVTEEMKAPELHVYVPAWAGQRMHIVSPEAVVILVDGKKDAAIQPTSTHELSEEFSNLLGATREGKALELTFPLSALKDGNVIRIVWDIGKEMNHKVKTEKVR